VWVDKGRWVYPETLRAVQEKTGALLVHHTPDAQLVSNTSRHFNACIPLYDLISTTKPFEVELYRANGARRIVLVWQGYDDRFSPQLPTAQDLAEYGSDVTFVGHYQHHYADRLRAASRVSERTRIWGPGWRRYSRLHPWVRAFVSGDGLWGASYPRALACTKIALGLLSKRIPETTTTRTFEIPATGVFMLAERTEDHLSLFKEGVEAEFFDSDDELIEKMRFYLAHDSAREKIAAAGRERCVQGGYHARNQLKKVMTQLTS
jgi:spore maturation protein CgeB